MFELNDYRPSLKVLPDTIEGLLGRAALIIGCCIYILRSFNGGGFIISWLPWLLKPKLKMLSFFVFTVFLGSRESRPTESMFSKILIEPLIGAAYRLNPISAYSSCKRPEKL